ncbi:hypothetical protein AV656_14100 [Bhargavaea cecembensis]|uniref:Uncharacterized protein n=2 Tax=Bhargavaea cecembensis TaxID=394098 RepID=A0A163EQ15_9BACL|nr:hypothetical protein AV656_14100 [Bhargavaea cecembensis]
MIAADRDRHGPTGQDGHQSELKDAWTDGLKPDQPGKGAEIMTRHENYPNARDYDPQRGDRNEGELPLADPSESNSTDIFRENENEDTGNDEPSAFEGDESPDKGE